ncbi:VWA domain-containing protein [Vibrio sp. T187]|uniref:Ig-like domain-containing protein n=1 Tax=Vibrio TaxID=662 RepID=UPI0010C94BD8|nr:MULTISPECIES: Ig-like domain-containing protein [Vibrio]MBW3696979.1 VWA domain-containing protein [Vibrio sp. T187]
MDLSTLIAGGALTIGQRIVLDINGNIKLLELGESPQFGDVVLESFSGNPDATPKVSRISEEGEVDITSEIEDIFAALEEGQDPTQLDDEFATAAGAGTGSSLVSAGSVERDGAESIAETEFDTAGLESLGLSTTQSLALLEAFNSESGTSASDTTADADSNFSVTVASSDEITNAEEADDVSVTLGGVDADAVSVKVTFSDGTNSVVVDATETGGVWSVADADLTSLTDGNITVTALVTDSSGNAKEVTDTLLLDTELSKPTIDLVDGSDTGVSNSDNLTNDTTPTFALGNIDSDADTVEVFDGSTKLGDAVQAGDGSWSFTPSTPLADGTYDLSVKVTDDAGNESSSDALSVEVDIELSKPTIDLVDGSDTGVSNSDNLTNDTTPTFALGNIDSDADTVEVFDGSTKLGDAVQAGDGSWSFTPSTPLADGTYDLSVKVTDDAGNESSSDALSVMLDTDEPTVVITATDTNLSAGEATTITFQFSEAVEGFAEEDITVAGGTLSGLTQVDGDTWTATFTQSGNETPSVTVTDESYTDVAGNQGAEGTLSLDSIQDKPEAQDFSVGLNSQGEASFTFDGGQSGSQDNVSDQEDDISGTPVQIVMLEEPLFGTIYDVSSGTPVPVSANTAISSEAQLEYVEDTNAVDNLDFVASQFSSEVNSGASSVDFLNGSVSISSGSYTGNGPTPGNVSSSTTYLSYVSGSQKDGFGVSTAPSSNSELDVTSKEFISIDYSDSGAVITEANVEFGSVYSHYNEGHSAEGEINIVALDADGNVVAQFNYDADEDNGDLPLVIDSNGVATVNVNVPGGFTELRVYTTQDGSDSPTTNSNITLKGVDVVSAELNEVIDYKSLDSDGLLSDETAQLTISDNTVELAPVAQDDTVSVFGGLSGYYYASSESVNGNLESVQDALDVIASKDPDLTFDAKDINYTLDGNGNGLSSQTQFEDFLNNDASSVEGTVGSHTDGVVQMSGSVYLEPGDYAFKVTADDGYTIIVDGVAVATVDENQSSTTTLHDSFTVDSAGYHSIEIVYWDQGGAANLDINLGTVDANGNYDNGEHDLNDFPLIGDVLATDEGQPLVVNSSLLLANDYDSNEGDTYSIVSDGFSSDDGQVAYDAVTGEVTFTPNPGVTGTASFTYTIVDSTGLTDTAVVTTSVNPASDGLTVTANISTPTNNVFDSIITNIENSLSGKTVDSTGDSSDNHLETTGTWGSWVDGLEGDDTIVYGSGMHMQARGGDDNDTIVGSDGSSTVLTEDLQGGDGSDTLIGGSGVSSSINLVGDDVNEVGDDVFISRSPTTTTTYYGGAGTDAAYLTGSSADYQFTTVGASDFTLVHSGTGNANHDFYSVESLYFSDGKYEVQGNELVQVAEVYELNIDIDLNDNDGSEVITSVVVSDVPSDVTLSLGDKQADGTWVISPSDLDSEGKVTLVVEAPLGTVPVLTVTAGAQEVNSANEAVDLPEYAQTQTGTIVTPSGDANGDDTIIGLDGDDVLLGDSGGIQDNSTAPTNYNLALVVDTSGSMGSTLNANSNQSRLDVVRAALISMLADIAGHPGVINLTLIGFESSASVKIDIDDLDSNDLTSTVNDAINALSADGGTNYEAAFDSAKDWFDDQPSGYENMTFFLTDGIPTVSTTSGSNNGSTTEYNEFVDSVSAFQELSTVSSVRAIGIGDGINSDILEYFDNTDSSGASYSTSTEVLADFTNSTGEAWSLSNFTVVGGSAQVVSSRVHLVDEGSVSGATVMTSPQFTVATDSASVITFTASQGDDFGGGDTFTWVVQKFDSQSQTWVDVTSGNGTGTIETDLLYEGTYQLVLSVFEDQSGYTADVYLDDFSMLSVTAPTGNVEIVNSAQDLQAVLDEGSQEITLLPVGDDNVNGGAGNDILFGDAINTDNLPWSENGLTRPDSLADGSGLDALTTFLQMLNGIAPSDVEVYEYVRENHHLFSVDGDTRGGNDTVDGGLGDDIIYAQGGNDILIGGLGDDILTGGDGDDIFKWVDDTLANHEDVITDFHVNEDHIDISQLLPEENTMGDLLAHISVSKEGDDDLKITISENQKDADDIGDTQVILLENVTGQEVNIGGVTTTLGGLDADGNGSYTGDELTNLVNSLMTNLPNS